MVVYIGGGGSSKTGISNRLEVAEVLETQALKIITTVDTGPELCVRARVLWDVVVIELFCRGAALSATTDGTRVVACFGRKLRAYKGDCLAGQPLEATAEVIADFHEKEASLNCCGLDPGGKVAATGGEDGTLRLWSALDVTQLLAECEAHSAAITALEFASAGHLVCTSSKDCTCRIWSAATGHALCVLDVRAHCPPAPNLMKKKMPSAKLSCRACAFLNESTLCSVASYSRGPAYVHHWTIELTKDDKMEATATKSIKVSTYPVSAMAARPNTLVFGDVDGRLIVLNAHLNKIRQARLHDLPVTAIALAQNTTIFSTSADSKLGVLALNAGAFHPALTFIVVCLAVLMALAAASLYAFYT